MTAALTLYDLAGAEPDRRFSPYCWRTRLAIAHKGLAVETIPWRFTEKETLAFSGQGKVPVLVDGARTIADSWAIAEYLEDTYPDRPSLFGDGQGRALARFINHWTDSVLHPAIARLILTDIHAHLHEKDQDYFRMTRERFFGATLETVCQDREERVVTFRQGLAPLRATLAVQPFLSGDCPAYADYIVFGAFQWARATSPFALLATDDPIAAWRGRMLDAFNQLAHQTPGYDQ